MNAITTPDAGAYGLALELSRTPSDQLADQLADLWSVPEPLRAMSATRRRLIVRILAQRLAMEDAA